MHTTSNCSAPLFELVTLEVAAQGAAEFEFLSLGRVKEINFTLKGVRFNSYVAPNFIAIGFMYHKDLHNLDSIAIKESLKECIHLRAFDYGLKIGM